MTLLKLHNIDDLNSSLNPNILFNYIINNPSPSDILIVFILSTCKNVEIFYPYNINNVFNRIKKDNEEIVKDICMDDKCIANILTPIIKKYINSKVIKMEQLKKHFQFSEYSFFLDYYISEYDLNLFRLYLEKEHYKILLFLDIVSYNIFLLCKNDIIKVHKC